MASDRDNLENGRVPRVGDDRKQQVQAQCTKMAAKAMKTTLQLEPLY